MPVIPALGRLKEEDCLKLKVGVGYIVGSRARWTTECVSERLRERGRRSWGYSSVLG